VSEDQYLNICDRKIRDIFDCRSVKAYERPIWNLLSRIVCCLEKIGTHLSSSRCYSVLLTVETNLFLEVQLKPEPHIELLSTPFFICHFLKHLLDHWCSFGVDSSMALSITPFLVQISRRCHSCQYWPTCRLVLFGKCLYLPK